MSWRERRRGMSVPAAVSAIKQHKILLVYPITNKPSPLSLWHVFFPRTKMHWAWDETHDSRVVRLWDLRERVSRLNSVVYAKWYQGRATFFSKDTFSALLARLHEGQPQHPRIGAEAAQLLAWLTESSPQTTKKLKRLSKEEWTDKEYDRGMKELWQKALIVGRGEVDDGAFPSLNVSATELAFPDVWAEAQSLKPDQWNEILMQAFPDPSPWRKQLERIGSSPLKKIRRKTRIRYEDL